MKSLIVSLKSSSEALGDFKSALKKARKRKLRKGVHYDVSFDNKKDFDRFIKNIYLLSMIISFRPKSVYELAKIAKIDVSNLNKTILSFEEIGVLKIKEMTISGRKMKCPLVEYGKIEFLLAA